MCYHCAIGETKKLELFLPAKVYTYVEVERTKEVIGRELIFAVIIGMKYSTDSGIPMCIVPHESESADTIHVEIVNIEVSVSPVLIFFHISF